MHVALIIDDERLAHEQAMINRLCIGLIGESVQVTRIVPDTQPPDSLEEAEQRMGLATRLEAPMRVLPWMRAHRASRIAVALERAMPDVLFAVGADAWQLGMDVAQTIDRPALLDVSCKRHIEVVPVGRRAASVAGYVVPMREMAGKLGQRVGAEMVSLVPIGVSATAAHSDDEDEDEDDDERVLTLAVLGESRDVAAYRAMLEGLSRVAREQPGMQVIMELHGPHEHEIWRHVQRLDLLGAVSSIADFGNYRSLLAGCDIMLVPERFGDLRSVILEGMGQSAAPIVSAESPLDVFVSNETAVFVRHAEADDWAHAVLKLAGDAAERQRLGEAARRVILARHRSSDQVSGLIVTLERVLRGGAIPFAGENSNALSGKS